MNELVEPMEDLLIQKATMSDLDELVKLRLSFQRHMEASNPRVWRVTKEGKEPLGEETEQMLAKEDGNMLVAVRDGTVTGFAYGEVSHGTTYTPNTIGQILIVYVREDLRRQGIGTQLVEELCRLFSSKDVEEVTVNYIVGNMEAEGFWGALEFEPIRISANLRANLRLEELEERLRKMASHSKPSISFLVGEGLVSEKRRI